MEAQTVRREPVLQDGEPEGLLWDELEVSSEGYMIVSWGDCRRGKVYTDV